LNFTDPKALRKLLEFSNIQTKVYLQEKYGGFHTKAYIFEFEDEIKLFIGSSNITENALLRNIEWNVKIISKKEHPLIEDIYYQFNQLWEKTQIVDDSFLFEYEKFVQELKEFRRNEEKFVYRDITVTPNTMQLRAIQQLHRLRTRGEDRGLVIAATATGKTYMSAFDVQQFNPRRMLFIVHREDILIKAEESFRKVLGSKLDTGVLSGNHKDFNAKYLFATINSLNNHYQRFNQNTFDYIVVDEAHHAVAESYIKMLDYFKPKFILGMTATPERTDGFQLFSLFKNNIALEIRLYDAIESDLVVPFHYFGITEAEDIDLSTVDENDALAITRKLSVHHRVTYIIEKLKLYGHDGSKLKALGFCASLEHAQYMRDQFNKLGIRSEFLSGSNSVDDRTKAVLSLESNETDSIEVIFSVDVFNEGIDIPSVNTVLMLRPTNSPIIFIQQLGRGLRKHESKSFVTVLDFIGNYKKSYLIAIALNGSKFTDKDSLRVSVKTNFANLPGTAFVQMDEIAKEQILKQLESENFNSLKYLKDEYFSFKRQNNNQISYFLMLYELYEGSPDPIKFIKKDGNYLSFINRVEDSSLLNTISFTLNQLKALKQLSTMLPLRRPIEFIILQLLIEFETISISEIHDRVRSFVDNVTIETVEHAIRCLEGQYYDANEIKSYIVYVNYDIEHQKVYRSKTLHELQGLPFKPYLEDILDYGLTRYRREFGSIQYNLPFFVYGKTYNLKDTAVLSNSNKKPGAFFGMGVISQNNDYFIFAELNKDINTRPSINYINRIIDLQTMSWESPNSWKDTSPSAQNFIHHIERKINLYIFIRKFKKIDGVVQPFIYLGKVNYISHTSNNPIQFVFKFQNTSTMELFKELTTPTNLS
jgi:superfamily II DNA or RNA helicase